MSNRKTLHSGPRKRKARTPLPAPKPGGAVYVRSTLCVGRPKMANTSRQDVQYTRRSNRKARAAGFDNAVQYAAHLMRLYEYAKRLKRRMM